MRFQRPRHGPDPDAVESRDRVGAGGHEDDFRTGLDKRAAQKREFAVIADQNTDLADGRVEKAQAGRADHIPILALETGHDLFVLMPDPSLGAEQHRAVDGAFRGIGQGRTGGREDMEVEAPREIRVKAVAGFFVTGDLVQARLEVGGDCGAAERGQLHRAIFRKDQQVAIGCRLDPAGDLGLVIGETVEPVEIIGRGCDFDFGHSVFIQNCRGLRVQ